MGDEAALPLAWRILLAVHDEQIARADRARQGVPLTRLSKRLDASVSVLMREITMLTDAVKDKNMEDNVRVKDVMELLAEACAVKS